MSSKNKIAVAMSGGVDSSVVAALLKEQGYDIFGVFFHFGNQECGSGFRENVCCSLEAQEDARKVAHQLGIKFYTLNLSAQFEKDVIKYFINEYAAGRTPNPCVQCNRLIKFGEALRKVRAMGADYLATGHYATIDRGASQSPFQPYNRAVRRGDRGVRLLHSADQIKDQTYFLSQLTQDQLKHILFPISHLDKKKVRTLAQKYKLPTAAKRESQEVCFIPRDGLGQFLKKHLAMPGGEIRDLATKKTIGKHQGLFQYTIGQRKGIGLAGGPWYAAKLDVNKNILWVTNDLEAIKSAEFKISKVNWISGQVPTLPLNVKCKVRYGAQEVSATITKKVGSKYFVILQKPLLAITPGQTAVFWKNKQCLGGGSII